MIDWILAVLASYLHSAWEWVSGVAPYVGMFGLGAIVLALFAALIMQARYNQQRKKWAESIRPGKVDPV